MSFHEFEFESAENPDWNFARTRRSVLMIPSAEWVQSMFSCQFQSRDRTFVVPNRDYPYEGLLVHQDGENWKFIDCIGIAIQTGDGRQLSFLNNGFPPAVRVTPWQATYCYTAVLPADATLPLPAEVPISVRYQLHSASTGQRITGSFEVAFPPGRLGRRQGMILTIQPLLDIRHMFGQSDFAGCSVEIPDETGGVVRVTSYDRVLEFYLPPGEITCFPAPEIRGWWYKLGTGQRAEVPDPLTRRLQTSFLGENKEVAAFFDFRPEIDARSDSVRLSFCCRLASGETVLTPLDLQRIVIESEAHDRECERHAEALVHDIEEQECRNAVLARIVGLTNYKVFFPLPESGAAVPVPPAGAWWFKTPWFRDVFEGILNSFQTLMSMPGETGHLRTAILLALNAQNKDTGLVPNRFVEFRATPPTYNSSDATLLSLITAHAYVRETHDAGLALKAVRVAMQVLAAAKLACRSSCEADGPPRIDPTTGLLLSAPHHSWMDTRSQVVQYAGYNLEWLPNRVSARFVRDLFEIAPDGPALGALLSSPCYFLPEINAQWIVMLRGLLQMIPLAAAEDTMSRNHMEAFREEVSSILCSAERSFLPVFWNEENGSLYNLAYQDGKVKDEADAEPAVVAVAILGTSAFSREQMARVWERIKKRLLVMRRLVRLGSETWPFGIVAKQDDRRVFYNDGQYHSDVVWLRSTPYLIRLLRSLGEEETARQLVRNALDHQMTEGAVFFNHELFSRPFGNNQDPDPETCRNPVPVKNPIQFWSQWCDAVIDFPDRKEPWQ